MESPKSSWPSAVHARKQHSNLLKQIAIVNGGRDVDKVELIQNEPVPPSRGAGGVVATDPSSQENKYYKRELRTERCEKAKSENRTKNAGRKGSAASRLKTS